MSIVAKRSPISATTELLLCNGKINMNFEEEIKTTYKEVTENSDASSKNLKSELKKNYDAVDTSSKNVRVSQFQNALVCVFEWSYDWQMSSNVR